MFRTIMNNYLFETCRGYIFYVLLTVHLSIILDNILLTVHLSIILDNVLLTVHLSIILDNEQLDTHLLYFTIRLL